MLLLCRLQLNAHDFEVVTATSGAEAVSAIETQLPDVVVMDYTLPDMDGPDLVESLRSRVDEEVPVVMLTARTGIEAQETAWGAGIFDYVIKPFDESRLTEAVEAALSPDRREDAQRRSSAALDRLRENDVAGWRQMATVIEHAEDAIITKALDGTITSWNPAAERLYGYRVDEVIGQHISILETVESAGETTESDKSAPDATIDGGDDGERSAGDISDDL